MGRFITNPKANLKKDGKSVIYKVECEEWNKCCVGQTERKLAIRKHENKNATRGYETLSVIFVHEEGHSIWTRFTLWAGRTQDI